jgi:hypothetical protein
VDSRIFWSAQYIMCLTWIVFAIVAILSFAFSDLTVCAVGAVLCITNTMGYVKCDKNHQSKMGSYLMTKAKDNLSGEQVARIGMYAMSNQGRK